MDEAPAKKTYLNLSVQMLAIGLAFWPVLAWYASRTCDRSDEPWGILGLIAAATFVWLSVRAFPYSSNRQTTASTIMGLASLLVYICTFQFAPNLVKGLLLIAATWFLLLDSLSLRGKSGVLGLFVLSLPLIPSLNFFAGYPLRVVISMIACFMLNILGLPAVQDGTMLSVAGQPVSIDAPCSGINMLWVDAFLAMVAAAYFGLTSRKVIMLVGMVAGSIIIGNAWRATALVLFDKFTASQMPGMAAMEPTVHLGIGLVTMCLIAATTLYTATYLATLTGNPSTNVHLTPVPKSTRAYCDRILIVLCACAAGLPFFLHPATSASLDYPEPSWPSKINGAEITPVASLAEEKAFAADFPGRMRRFTDGHNAYFVRVVNKETRQLHPSSDCFKGLGYSIDPKPIVVGTDNSRWSSFIASKSGQVQYRVLERTVDSTGNSWTDVSEWYWAACFNRTRGPWWSITIAQPIGSECQSN